MATKFTFKYKGDIKDLEKVNDDIDDIVKEVLLKGANVAADSLRSTTRGLKTGSRPGNGKRYLNATEKSALLANM